MPNLKTLSLEVKWGATPEEESVPRDFAELAEKLRCLRRFGKLTEVNLTVENGSKNALEFDYTVGSFSSMRKTFTDIETLVAIIQAIFGSLATAILEGSEIKFLSLAFDSNLETPVERMFAEHGPRLQRPRP